MGYLEKTQGKKDCKGLKIDISYNKTETAGFQYHTDFSQHITITVIESRNSVNLHYFDTKSLIWSQIFDENLSVPIAMNIGKIKFLQI